MSLEVEHYARRGMAALGTLAPASACAFYLVDAQCRPYRYLLDRMPVRVHETYLAHYQQHDPLHPSRFDHSVAVVPMAEAMSRAALSQSRYGGFMRLSGMCDVVELFVRRAGRVVAGFSLIRGQEQGCFDAEDIRALTAAQTLLELAVDSRLPLADADAPPGLTAREREVALLLKDGASNKTIARLLGLELPTVKTHLQHLYRKCGVRNRTELASRLFLGAAHTMPG